VQVVQSPKGRRSTFSADRLIAHRSVIREFLAGYAHRLPSSCLIRNPDSVMGTASRDLSRPLECVCRQARDGRPILPFYYSTCLAICANEF